MKVNKMQKILVNGKSTAIEDFKALAKYCRVDFIALVDGELKIR